MSGTAAAVIDGTNKRRMSTSAPAKVHPEPSDPVPNDMVPSAPETKSPEEAPWYKPELVSTETGEILKPGIDVGVPANWGGPKSAGPLTKKRNLAEENKPRVKSRVAKKAKNMSKQGAPSKYVEKWKLFNWCVGTYVGQLTALCVIGAVQVAVGALLWAWAGGSADYPGTFWSSVWASWVMFVDPGTHTGLGAEESTRGMKTLAVILSLAGFTYFVTILGVVVDWIRIQMDQWQSRYNQVVMNDHIVILGWSVKTLFLIKELTIDNESTGNTLELVILSEHDRFECERTIRLFMQSCMDEDLMNTVNVICWQGDPQESDDLMRVSLRSAKNIIILGSGGDSQSSDQEVLRTILAIQGLQGKVKGRIIAEVCVMDNQAIIQAIGYDVLGIVARDMVNRVMVFYGIVPAIGDAWSDLMTFVGNEFYCFPFPDHEGKTWGEIRGFQNNFIMCGVIQDNCQKVYWSPPDDYQLAPGEEVVVISDDDEIEWFKDTTDRRTIGHHPEVQVTDAQYPNMRDVACQGPKVVCIIGWASDTADILALINTLVGEGSEIHILSPMNLLKRALKIMEANLAPADYVPQFTTETPNPHHLMPDCPTLKNITVSHYLGSPVVHHQLFSLPIARADTILILADDECEEPIESDSIVITSLLHLSHEEDIALKRKPSCEVCDWRSERIVRKSELLKSKGNFLRSSELETGMFALCAHHPLIGSVMRDLLDMRPGTPRISEILVDVFIEGGVMASFAEMSNRVKKKGDTLIGYYKESAPDAILNPENKRDQLLWENGDLLLVITFGPPNLLVH